MGASVAGARPRRVIARPISLERDVMNKQILAVSIMALTVANAAPAMAQSAPAQADENAARGGGFDEIIVTGRIAGSLQRKAEASYAITTLNDAALRITNPVSVAEIFKQVPGFWVEASGGEGSNNVRARGIPTDGYSSIALQENGLSVQYDGGLGYLNADQSFRFDETVSRVEAVRGGPASIYAPNAPGGIVNFITRKGTDKPGGLVKLTWGNYDLARIDAYYGQKIGDNWGVFVGGFYRQSHGMRDMGFMAEKGGQIRGTVNYDDGRNRFSLDVKHIDDKVPFYLPVPLTYDAGGKIVAVSGFDALRGTLAGDETSNIAIKNVTSPYSFDLTEGSHTKLTQIAIEADLQLGEAITFHTRSHYKDANILRNAVFPTGNVTEIGTFLASQASKLTSFPGATSLQARYVNGGQVLSAATNGNGLVVGGNLLSVSVPITEFISDNRLTADVEAAGRHSLALGMTYGGYNYRFDRYMGTTLLDVQGNAKLVDVAALNAVGAVVGKLTDNGFQRYGSLYDNVGMNSDNIALYAGDEWQVSDELRLDFAARWERTHFSGAVANKTTVNLGDATTLADDSVTTGTGTFAAVNRHFSDWGWTVGANYQFTKTFGAFARYTNTFRLPSAGDWNGNPTKSDGRSVPIQMAEVGVKYGSPLFNLFATGFYTKFQGISFTNYRFNTVTNQYENPQTVIADTQTFGLEVEALLRPSRFFDISFQATYQDPKYKGFTFTGSNGTVTNYDGKQLIRVPKLALRAVPAVNLVDGKLRAELEIEHYTKRYPDIANSQALPSYTMLNFNMNAAVTEAITLGLNVNNLTNTLGLTEGNPRAGEFNASDGNAKYFLARPNFGRSFRVTAGYRF
jgi:outer membrane receptor protein involved in Fe transport